MFTFRTIKSKLLLSFASFMLIGAVVVLSNVWFDFRKDQIEKTISILTKIDHWAQIVGKLEKDFFSDETINPKFYLTGESVYLEKRKLELVKIQSALLHLQKSKNIDIFGQEVGQKVGELRQDFMLYDIKFSELVYMIKERGFKDFGMEGKMRRSIHALESENVDLVLLLSLRRHEKDFIIRKDTLYLTKIYQTAAQLEQKIAKEITNPTERKKLQILLANYVLSFEDLAKKEAQIGFDNHKGIKKDLTKISDQIDTRISYINDHILGKAEAIADNMRLGLGLIISLGVMVNFILAFFATQVLSKPIQTLSLSIHEVIKNDFKGDPNELRVDTNDEISFLAKDFRQMLRKVQTSLAEIHEKSDNLERQQKILVDSIRYAQQIQEAILPDDEDLRPYFADYMIVYRPQNFVSGDFYWSVHRNDKTFWAVVDCTGHGVPGAFMSMIGHTLLTKIIMQDKIFDPAQALEHLHREIREALHQQGNKNDDGMEIGLCVLQTCDQDYELTFAGAKAMLFYSNKDELVYVKGTNRAIGGKQKGEHKNFEKHSAKLGKGEKIYLLSDGLIDQNDQEGTKFGKKRFKELLENIISKSFDQQHERINDEINQMLAYQTQRDDITIMGVQI